MRPTPISRKSIYVLVVFAAGTLSLATASRAQSVVRAQHGVTVTTDLFVTTVELWSGSAVRVQHRPVKEKGAVPPSFTVIASPQTAGFTMEESEKAVLLGTQQLQVAIDRRSGCVTITRQNHESVLAEQCGGTNLSSAWVGPARDTIASGQSFVLDPNESLFGLGQHPELNTFNLVGSSVRLLQRNTDVAVPVLLSSKGYLVLWDNPAVTQVDLGKTEPGTVHWQSEAGDGVDYYVVAGAQPDEAIAGYRWLTGAAPLFPRWSWGLWQSRERYKTQEEILSIAGEYRKRHIPLDGIVQDWQYWPPLNQETAQGGWGSHEFDPARYPDPAAMIADLHKEHVHLMAVSWAKFDVTNKGVSIPNLQKLEAVHGVFNPAIPYVYPLGRGKWYDPFNAYARKVYWDLLSTHLFRLGVDAWWLDASEAELSGNWGEFRDFKTADGSGATVFNAYPLEHTRSIFDGQTHETNAKRVLILTRSAYAGQQRNGAITWSGDISSKWDVLKQQVPAGLNFVASGIPYWNTDTGGFFGNNPDDPHFVELFTRWFQFSTFCPMLRIHGTDKPKEIWRFPEETQQTLTRYLDLRYHLLPYIYSVSWQVTHDGYTMMRPLVMDFPSDKEARNTPDEFMFGPDLLVSPVTNEGAVSRTVRLPVGTDWVDFYTGQRIKGGQTITAAAPIQQIPLYVRSGSILPYGPRVEYADQALNAPLEIRIYPGADGSFRLYDDVGDGYGYQKGEFATVPFIWNDRSATLTIGRREGSFPDMTAARNLRLVLVKPGHGSGIDSMEQVTKAVEYSGKPVSVQIGRDR